jgi:hypothetical protein
VHDEGAGVHEGARGGAAHRPAPQRPAAGARGLLSALDDVFPEGERLSHHEIRIRATPERVWQALLEQDLGSSPATKILLFLRGYGGRAFRRTTGTLPEKLAGFGFTKLDEIPEREIVFGIAGKFWRPDGAVRPLPDREAFLAFAEGGCVKAAWNLRVEQMSPETSMLSTETRIQYFGPAAHRAFRLYWTFVGPFSGLIRRALLRGVRIRAERTAR